MKKVVMSIISIIVVIGIIIVGNKKEKVEIKEEKRIPEMFAIMVGTDASNEIYGNYPENKWPKRGYAFNERLTTCVDGLGIKKGRVTFDRRRLEATVVSKGNTYCYLYFDVDNNAPEFDSGYGNGGFLIQNGATCKLTDRKCTSVRGVGTSLRWKSNDVEAYCVSNSSNPNDCRASDWIKVGEGVYSATKNHTLTVGNEEKTVYAHIRDIAENITTVSDKILLDELVPTAPSVAASDGKASNGWHNANYTVDGTIRNTNVSGNWLEYKVNTGGYTRTRGSVTYNTTGITYNVRVCSGAGLCSRDTTYIAKLDKTVPSAPRITVNDNINTSGAWHKTNIVLTGNKTNTNISGNITEYSANNSTWVRTQISVTANTPGTTYYSRICSGAGLCGGSTAHVVRLDKTVPVAPIITPSDGIGSGAWHNANFSLTGSVPSGRGNISGNTIQYSANNSSWTTTRTSLVSNVNATYYVRSCSGAGLCGGSSTYVARLDKNAPMVSITNFGSIAYVRCTDTGGSGVRSGNTSVYLSYSGQTVTGTCLDYAGNSRSSSRTFYYGPNLWACGQTYHPQTCCCHTENYDCSTWEYTGASSSQSCQTCSSSSESCDSAYGSMQACGSPYYYKNGQCCITNTSTWQCNCTTNYSCPGGYSYNGSNCQKYTQKTCSRQVNYDCSYYTTNSCWY